MYQINEFNNSAIGQTIAAEHRDRSDRKITLIVTGIVTALMIIAFKHAIGG
jgi:CHASE3 domain sensor protein